MSSAVIFFNISCSIFRKFSSEIWVLPIGSLGFNGLAIRNLLMVLILFTFAKVFLTLVCGIISSLLLLISGLLKYHEYSLYLFTIIITETVIAAVKLYGMSKFINNSMSKLINKS